MRADRKLTSLSPAYSRIPLIRDQRTDIDASLTFGFYVKDTADLMDLADSLQKSNTCMRGYPAISVAEQRRSSEAAMHDVGGEAAAAGLGEDDDDDDGFSLI